MNIVCVICSDLLIPSDDVFYTPCGHIFHFACLTQWLERSKSCPQCREKTTESKIHRIYFNFSNSDSIVEDASCLQDKIDKLKFQLLLRDSELKKYMEKTKTLEEQNKGLRKEVLSVESELREKNTAINALKDQAKYLKQQCTEVDSARQEIARLKKKVEGYVNVQALLEGSSDEVDDLISRTTDPNTLITYICVMKREMVTSLNKRRELRTKLRNLQQELTKVSMERNFLSEESERRKKLEADLLKCESEKVALQNELSSVKLQMSDKPSVASSSRVERSSEKLRTALAKESKKKEQDVPLSEPAMKENGENSPYLPVKSQSVFAMKEHLGKRRPGMNLGSSILSKKPRIEQTVTKTNSANIITYDGFGGHSKYERFPTPIFSGRLKKSTDDGSQQKKTKPDAGRNQQLSDFMITLTDSTDVCSTSLG